MAPPVPSSGSAHVINTTEAVSSRRYFSVASLIHDAGRCGPSSENCRCEADQVVELRLVAAALNRLPDRTYTAKGWQTKLVDFFNREFQHSTRVSREQRLREVRAVDKLLAGYALSDAEAECIDEIRKTWAEVKEELQGFKKFKAEFDDILHCPKDLLIRFTLSSRDPASGIRCVSPQPHELATDSVYGSSSSLSSSPSSTSSS